MIRVAAFILGYVAATVCMRALPPLASSLAGNGVGAAGLAILLILGGSALGGAAARIVAHDAPPTFFASIAGTFLFVQLLRLFVSARYGGTLEAGVSLETAGLTAGLILAGTVGLVLGALLVRPGRGSASRSRPGVHP